MEKLLVICGPTSTGKTKLAIDLAKIINGELISADSRQVYKRMNIGTGKDVPDNSVFNFKNSKVGGYYEIEGVKVWGYDLADPKEEFNISWFLKYAKNIIEEIVERKKTPILVGGTGLYIKGVVDGIPTADIPKNENLRIELEKQSVENLYERLSQMDSLKSASLNSSDKNNPRRLIRAIEVAQWKLGHGDANYKHNLVSKFSVLQVGLSAPTDFISGKIDKRVKDRVASGIKKEISGLIKSGINWEDQSMMSIGYRQWRDFYEGAVDEDQVVDDWKREERKYAGRQMTWFKKDNRIKWFDVTGREYPKNVENLVKKWYKEDVN